MISSASDTEYYPHYMVDSIRMDVVESPEKSPAPWISVPRIAEEAAERVKAWWERAQRVDDVVAARELKGFDAERAEPS